jgi:hypothetical protein
LLVAVKPSPAAVTVSVELPTADEVPAPSFNIALADPSVVLNGFDDQMAVTPLGSPLRLRLTLPANDPPVPTVMLTGVLAPCETETPVDVELRVSVGAALTVRA